ncbi:hypothetical protein RSAG8_12889, partial [Rhizoctonia solani AG-8 WAC10335]
MSTTLPHATTCYIALPGKVFFADVKRVQSALDGRLIKSERNRHPKV